MAQVAGNPQKLTWSCILSSKCVWWNFCDIRDKNVVNQVLAAKMLFAFFKFLHQKCSDFYFFSSHTRTEDWVLRIEDWGQPFHLLWLASLSPFETTKILINWKNPHSPACRSVQLVPPCWQPIKINVTKDELKYLHLPFSTFVRTQRFCMTGAFSMWRLK